MSFFFEIIDTCLPGLENRFDESQACCAILSLKDIYFRREKSIDSDVLSYPELMDSHLEMQLKLLHASGNGPFKPLELTY